MRTTSQIGGGIIKIGILGYDILDFSVYLSMILKNLQYCVSVTDMTHTENSMFNWQDSCENSYRKIYFYKGWGAYYNGSIKNPSEVSLFLFDNEKDELIDEMDKMFVITDTKYDNVIHIKDCIRNFRQMDGLVFRDVTENGVNANFIVKHILKDDYLVDMQKKGKIHEIVDDLYDREYKISLQYEGITNFKHLSEKFLKCLSGIAREISANDTKSVERAVSRAKDGEIIEYSILE